MIFTLDPSEVAKPGRSELSLMSGTITVKPEGIDWGDSALEAYKAQQKFGEPVVDVRWPNRIVRAPLVLKGEPGGDTLVQAITRLQAVVARMAQEGGHLKRIRGTEPLYADVQTAAVRIPDTWTGAHRDFETEGEIVLECLPDLYGDEETLIESVGSGSLVIEKLEGVKGNFPARTRVRVTNEDSDPLNGVLLGFRPSDDSASAAMVFEAEDLDLLGGSSVESLSGASGGQAVKSTTAMGSSWHPSLRFNSPDPSPNMTHEGDYRVWARVRAYGSGTLQIRMAWALNSLDRFSYNVHKTLPKDQFFNVDLGSIRLRKTPLGGHRWEGILQVRDAESGVSGTVHIDRVELQPVSETGGRLSVPVPTAYPIEGLAFRDTFQQSSGDLIGKSLAGVGTYVEHLDNPDSSSPGAAQFMVDATNDIVTRTVTGYSNKAVGFGSSDVSLSNMRAEVEFMWPTQDFHSSGLLLKSSALDSFVHVSFFWGPYAGIGLLVTIAAKLGASTWISIGGGDLGGPPLTANTWHLMQVDLIGDTVTLIIDGQERVSAQHGVLPALDPGGVYLYDGGTGDLGAQIHKYRNFAAYEYGEASASGRTNLMYPGRSVELTSQGCYRESEDGGYWDKVPIYGQQPRIPVPEGNGDVDMFLRVSNGDFVQSGDNGLFGPSATVYYRPCWLSVPEE